MVLETFYVPPSPPLQFFGRFTSYLLLAMCGLGGLIAMTGGGAFGGSFDADGNAIPSAQTVNTRLAANPVVRGAFRREDTCMSACCALNFMPGFHGSRSCTPACCV